MKMYRSFNCYQIFSKRHKHWAFQNMVAWPKRPKVAYSTVVWTDHLSAIFSSFIHTFPPNYVAAVKDVVTNCLNTNCVSKQISAVSESFGKYREWQHWLSIWAQLFSSLVGTHKHMNKMTDAHMYTAVSGLGVQRRHLNSALHTCRRWNWRMQVLRDMKTCLENRSFCRLYSIWTVLLVIAPMYQ